MSEIREVYVWDGKPKVTIMGIGALRKALYAWHYVWENGTQEEATDACETLANTVTAYKALKTTARTPKEQAENYGPCPVCGAATECETNVYADGAIHTVTCADGCGFVDEIDGPTNNWLNHL